MTSKGNWQAKRYCKAADLKLAQTALMGWVQQSGHCNYLHKGDIGHRLFNGCYGNDLTEMFRYWTDENDDICAFAILYPPWQAFDLQVAPGSLFSDQHSEIFDYCERETLRLGNKHSLTINGLVAEASDCNPAQIEFIEARGYKRDKHSITLTRHDLWQVPEARLPEGFRFHIATISDAAALADVHNHSFTNKWNAHSYGEVFSSPHLEYEFVVVAPDGRFSAFTNLWIDEVNRSLLFEPVGTHSDFRRRGIGKALMVYLLRRMQAEHDIACAYVCHESPEKNPASSALYTSVGFKKLHDFQEYVKRLPST